MSIPYTFRIVLTISFMGMLMFVSLIPGHYQPGDSSFVWLLEKTPTFLQKILHICLYVVFALLLVWTLEIVRSRTIRYLLAFIFAISFGAVMEWSQTMVRGRFGSLFDFGLNTTGAALGLLAAIFLLSYWLDFE